jgi:diacylglycerol kinase family enzyme
MRKFPAMLLAAVQVLWRFPLLGVCIETPDRTVLTKTPVVFVGNNEYGSGRSLTRREHLDRGNLFVHTIRARSRLHMLWLCLRAAFGRKKGSVETQHVTEASVRSKKRKLAVAIDGEVVHMQSPLYYRIRPGALLVRRAPREAVHEPIAIGAAR